MEQHGYKIRQNLYLREFLKKKTYNEVEKLIKLKKLPALLRNDDMALAAMEFLRRIRFRGHIHNRF